MADPRALAQEAREKAERFPFVPPSEVQALLPALADAVEELVQENKELRADLIDAQDSALSLGAMLEHQYTAEEGGSCSRTDDLENLLREAEARGRIRGHDEADAEMDRLRAENERLRTILKSLQPDDGWVAQLPFLDHLPEG